MWDFPPQNSCLFQLSYFRVFYFINLVHFEYNFNAARFLPLQLVKISVLVVGAHHSIMSRATFAAAGKSISPSRRTRCCAPIESARALSQAGTLSQLDTPSLFYTRCAAGVHISNIHNMLIP
jgi:hypothetical protein